MSYYEHVETLTIDWQPIPIGDSIYAEMTSVAVKRLVDPLYGQFNEKTCRFVK